MFRRGGRAAGVPDRLPDRPGGAAVSAAEARARARGADTGVAAEGLDSPRSNAATAAADGAADAIWTTDSNHPTGPRGPALAKARTAHTSSARSACHRVRCILRRVRPHARDASGCGRQDRRAAETRTARDQEDAPGVPKFP